VRAHPCPSNARHAGGQPGADHRHRTGLGAELRPWIAGTAGKRRLRPLRRRLGCLPLETPAPITRTRRPTVTAVLHRRVLRAAGPTPPLTARVLTLDPAPAAAQDHSEAEGGSRADDARPTPGGAPTPQGHTGGADQGQALEVTTSGGDNNAPLPFAARGITRDSKCAINNATTGTPYADRAIARFEGSRGIGSKTDIRPCSLTFAG
jgi:hypothetical protein